jgi:hypothetical protein
MSSMSSYYTTLIKPASCNLYGLVIAVVQLGFVFIQSVTGFHPGVERHLCAQCGFKSMGSLFNPVCQSESRMMSDIFFPPKMFVLFVLDSHSRHYMLYAFLLHHISPLSLPAA